MPRFGIYFQLDESPVIIKEYIKFAEKFYFDCAWLTDHYFNRDVFMALALAASETKKIELGPGVVSPFLRHPVILASAVVSLDEISNGRALLGLGVGATSVTLLLRLKGL